MSHVVRQRRDGEQVPREYTYGNSVIKITRPVLTETERAKMEGRISIALQQFGKAMQDADTQKAVSA